jgi:hypothetical protein
VRLEVRISIHILDDDASAGAQRQAAGRPVIGVNGCEVIQEVMVQAAMGDDFQGSGRLVVELNIAEIRTLQFDNGVEYLVQSGLQVRCRRQPRAQLIQPGH